MRKSVLACGVAALAFGAMQAPASAAWEPKQPIEIVVPAGAGGATDQMARMLQAAIQKHDLLPVPTTVLLEGGASGGQGLMDMKASPGNAHKFIIAQSSIYTLPMATNIPFNWTDMTPVAIIALDEFVLWVNADSPYKTAKDYVEAAKKGGFRAGGTGSKREDHIITKAVEKAGGVKFSYIPYKSGGEASTQLVGNHIESNVNNPSENMSVWRAGQVRPLCVFDKERLPYTDKVTKDMAWSDIPTCHEAGIDFDYVMLRGIFLPAKVTDEQRAYYVDLFKKIAETPEYKNYMKAQSLKQVFISGDDMVNFLKEDEARHKELMSEAGFLAK